MKRVLLVEDSTTALMMAQMALSSLNCEVITARDGLEAVDRAMAQKPHLVLMDVEMPNLDGFEACKRLRALLGQKLPILLLTTRGSIDYVRRGFESGCTGYLTKPIANEELLAKVKAYLGA